jgi:hypothetical protein
VKGAGSAKLAENMKGKLKGGVLDCDERGTCYGLQQERGAARAARGKTCGARASCRYP